MMMNVTESFNNVLKGVRALSLCAIIELTFYRTTDYIRDRHVTQGSPQKWKKSLRKGEVKCTITIQEFLIYKLMSLRFDASTGMHLLIAPETPSNSVNLGATKLRTHTTSPNYSIFHAPM
jgi:hypothetical protein